jgi:uncharacterized delta-60 repeat protein
VAIDTTFGTGGRADTVLKRLGGVDAVALRSGKLLVAGNVSDPRLPSTVAALVRLNPDGTLDASFDGDGVATLPPSPGAGVPSPAQWNGLVLLADGRVLVGGGSREGMFAERDGQATLARYRDDGTLDPSFGGRGFVFAPTDGSAATINDVELLPGGKILAGGQVRYAQRLNDQDDFALWRFNPDGTPDATFGANGFRAYSVDHRDAITQLAVLPDGRFFAETTHGVFAFTADGTMGAQVGEARPGVMVLAPGDKLVVAVGGEMGNPVRGITVRRFLSDGTPDLTFGDGASGAAAVRMGASGEAISALAALPDGRLLLGGIGYQILPVTVVHSAVARLNADGTLDPNFGVGGLQIEPFAGAPPLGIAPAPGGRAFVLGSVAETVVAVAHQLDPGIVADPGGPYGPVDEGATVQVSAAGSSYAGGPIVAYEWDNDYSPGVGFNPTATGVTATLPVKQDRPAPNIVLRVTSADGLRATSSPAQLIVRNAAPTVVSVTVPPAVTYGLSMTVSGVVADPGNDPVSVRVDFGDGTPPVDAPVGAGNGFSATHTYQARGSYIGRITATDDQGASSTREFTVIAPDVFGNVFRDENDDGLRAAATVEKPFPGVTLYADVNANDAFDAADPSTVTDTSGDYRFTELPAGRYWVRPVVPTGWRITNMPGTIGPLTIGGSMGVRLNIGLSETARIGGTVFNDVNGNGVRDAGEGGWHGFESSEFLDLNNDGFLDPGEPVSISDPSTDLPRYVFRNVPPGTYIVRTTAREAGFPLEWVQTTPAERGGRTGHVVTVRPGEVAEGKDFGLHIASGSIFGRVYEDRNRDGVKSTSEAPLQNWIVYSDADNDGVFDPDESRTRSTASGNYALPILSGRTYTVRLALPEGWAQSQPANGAPYVLTPPAGGAFNADFGAHFALPSSVAARMVYYRGSVFDRGAPLSDPLVDRSIAEDKRPLLPGERAGFDNVTSYTRGLNGIMVDLRGLSQRRFGETEVPALFEFARSASPDAAGSWGPLNAAVRMAVRPGAGVGGSDRVVVSIPHDLLKNQWLRVTVLANNDTGLERPDVFYFGNLGGDTGDNATQFRVNALDLSAVKRGLNTDSPLTGRLDINRDGRVNALDVSAVRQSLNHSLVAIVNPPPPPGGGPAAARATSLLEESRA